MVDWRVLFGITITGLWISAGLSYLLGVVGWDNFLKLPTGDIGSFLEGAFAPLAFLWLVIGHFMQQSEISSNTKASYLQEKSARRQELHSRRNGYFRLLELVKDQLGSIAGYHYISVVGETGTGEVNGMEYADMRTASAKGDPGLFVRKMISLCAQTREDPKAIKELLFGTEIRIRHTENFIATFDKLLDSAREVDQNDMVVNALLFGSSMGMLYRIMRFVAGDESMNPLTGLTTIQSTEQLNQAL